MLVCTVLTGICPSKHHTNERGAGRRREAEGLMEKEAKTCAKIVEAFAG